MLYETTTDVEDSESFLLFSECDEQRGEKTLDSLENNSRAVNHAQITTMHSLRLTLLYYNYRTPELSVSVMREFMFERLQHLSHE